MPAAIKAKDVDPEAPAKAARAAKRKALRVHRNKTFDQLTPVEKDEILKLAAIKLGLIAEDP